MGKRTGPSTTLCVKGGKKTISSGRNFSPFLRGAIGPKKLEKYWRRRDETLKKKASSSMKRGEMSSRLKQIRVLIGVFERTPPHFGRKSRLKKISLIGKKKRARFPYYQSKKKRGRKITRVGRGGEMGKPFGLKKFSPLLPLGKGVEDARLGKEAKPRLYFRTQNLMGRQCETVRLEEGSTIYPGRKGRGRGL